MGAGSHSGAGDQSKPCGPPRFSPLHQVSFTSRAPSLPIDSHVRFSPAPLDNPLFCLTKSQNAGLHPHELAHLNHWQVI